MIPDATTVRRSLVLQLKQEVNVRRGLLPFHAQGGASDFSDRATIVEIANMVTSFGNGRGRKIRDLTATIIRIDEGVWGKCQGCGKRIPNQRLEALPTAENCVTCQEAVELETATAPPTPRPSRSPIKRNQRLNGKPALMAQR